VGGPSGATLEEAISWGKESPAGKNAAYYCDVTIALPIVVHALVEKVDRRDNPPGFSRLFNTA